MCEPGVERIVHVERRCVVEMPGRPPVTLTPGWWTAYTDAARHWRFRPLQILTAEAEWDWEGEA